MSLTTITPDVFITIFKVREKEQRHPGDPDIAEATNKSMQILKPT